MDSATLFLPRLIIVLTNLATSLSPYFGSGKISLFLTSPLRGMLFTSVFSRRIWNALVVFLEPRWNPKFRE